MKYLLLFPLMVITLGAKVEKECPRECNPEFCPNIGPIKLENCPETYLVKDKCGCCQTCAIAAITTTVSPSKRSEVCQNVSCPKKEICVLNMQGLPVCRCPNEDLCRKFSASTLAGKKHAVCGSNGVTYPSRCHLKVASCKLDKKIRAVSFDSCVQPEQPPAEEQNAINIAISSATPKRGRNGQKQRQGRKHTQTRIEQLAAKKERRESRKQRAQGDKNDRRGRRHSRGSRQNYPGI